MFVNGTLNGFDVPSVGVDERAAGELATRHLLDLEHRRIGFVAGPEHYLPTQLKAAGRRAALESERIDPDGLVAFGEFGVAGGRAAAGELLDRPDPPTGVICSSDVMAIGVLQAALDRGLTVPRDLSVVGFDGDRLGVDPAVADDDRAADRRDRGDGRGRAPPADRRSRQAAAALRLPAAPPARRVDRAPVRTLLGAAVGAVERVALGPEDPAPGAAQRDRVTRVGDDGRVPAREIA